MSDIVERAISPFNPATNRVQNRDKYNLFAPIASTNRIGMAGFNPAHFKVDEQIVSLNDGFSDLDSRMTTAEEDIDNLENRMDTAEEDIDNLEISKLDKVTTGGFAAYTHVGSTQTQTIVSQSALNGAIVQRISRGQITVPATPSNYTDATSKQYVDDEVSGGVNSAVNSAVSEAGQYTNERHAAAKEYTDSETTRATNAEVALSQRLDAQEGLGGMLSAYDFGTDTPYIHDVKDLITPYALSQIPSINNDETKIWNGTKVSNLFDGRTWQLTNTQNTTPVVFEWVNIGATFMAKATNDTLGVGKGSDTVKVNAGGEFYTSTTLIGAATEEQFEVLDTQVSKAVTDVKTAISNMEATLGLAALWDAEGENELLDAEEEYLLSVAHIDANSINGREFYVMSKAEHAALIQAGAYVPDAFYLTF